MQIVKLPPQCLKYHLTVHWAKWKCPYRVVHQLVRIYNVSMLVFTCRWMSVSQHGIVQCVIRQPFMIIWSLMGTLRSRLQANNNYLLDIFHIFGSVISKRYSLRHYLNPMILKYNYIKTALGAHIVCVMRLK